MTIDQKIDRALARLDRELLEARADVARAEKAAIAAFHKAMVPGRTVKWMHGHLFRFGTVIEPPDNWSWHSADVRVKSEASGKTLRISAHNIEIEPPPQEPSPCPKTRRKQSAS